MADQPKNTRPDEDTVWALGQIIQTADAQMARHPASTFAYPAPASGRSGWQRSEYHNFFFNDVFQRFTGRTSGCDHDIRSVALSDDAEKFLAKNCVNPYWLWKVIGEAVKHTAVLPLYAAHLEAARKRLMDEAAATLAKHAGGLSSGTYSGSVTPWHIRDALEPGYLHRTTHWRDAGFLSGFLIMSEITPTEKDAKPYMMKVVINPLLEPITHVMPKGEVARKR